MARDDENTALNANRSPEDAEGYKVAVGYVFNPERNKFYPDSKDLYSTEPKVHRENVTSVDTEPPTVEAGIDCEGFKRCRFDVEVQGDSITSLKVGLLRWNSRASKWFGGGAGVDITTADDFTTSGGCVSLLEDEVFGATIFLKVSQFEGVNFAMNVDYALC